MNLRASILGVVCVWLWANPATAQPAQSPSTFTLRDGTVDLAVPESPAFSALGLTPEQVSRPTTPRELATSFLNGVDRNGNLQTGVAVDVAPYMLLAGPKITLRDYQTGPSATRFLARWQVSFASSKGGSGDPSAKLALGMRFTVLDRGDPRLDTVLVDCLVREGARVFTAPIPPFQSEEEQVTVLRQREEQVRVAVKPCREAAAKRRWNRTAWIAGVAPTWTSRDGSTAEVAYSGTAVWTSLGYGFERVPMLEDHAMLAQLAQEESGQLSVIGAFNWGLGAR